MINNLCYYCLQTTPTTAWVVTGCPEQHVIDSRICRDCFNSFCGHNVHLCRACNRAITDWAAQHDGYNIVLSWDTR